MNLYEVLTANKPHLNEKSKKVYISIINGLSKRINKKISSQTDLMNNLQDILKLMEQETYNTRKTRLSSILAFLPPDIDHGVKNYIQSLMLSDIKKYKEQSENGEKTETQKNNWVDWSMVHNMKNVLLKKVLKLLKTPSDIDTDESLFLRNCMLLFCYVFIEPRRSMDYSEMKIRDFTKNDNFYNSKNSTFIFNKYKTQKVYGTQEVKLPKDFKLLLDKYIKLLPPTQIYMFEENNEKLSVSKITKILNGLFRGRRVSVNILRHSYLTHIYGDKFKDMKNTAKNMGHSIETALNTYIKT